MSICSYSSLQTPNFRSYVETLTEPEIAVTVEDEQVSCTALTEFPGVRTAKNGCVEHYFVKRLSDRQGQGGDCKWKGTLPNGATNALKKVSTAPRHALIFAFAVTVTTLVLLVLNLTALRLLATGEQKILFIINCDILLRHKTLNANIAFYLVFAVTLEVL
jgi:hypothetical protein